MCYQEKKNSGMSLAAMETLAKSDNTRLSASSSPHNKKREEQGNWKPITYKLQRNTNLNKRKLSWWHITFAHGLSLQAPRAPWTTETCPSLHTTKFQLYWKDEWIDAPTYRNNLLTLEENGMADLIMNFWLKILHSLQFLRNMADTGRDRDWLIPWETGVVGQDG